MITPVILCGGSGTRLWPVSRKSYPKQFVSLVGDESLFQTTVQRLSGVEGFKTPLVLTHADFRFMVGEQMAALDLPQGTLLVEPEGRNTAAPILAAVLHALERDADATLLVMPSDHLIPAPDAFRAAVARGMPDAQAGRLVTFGIQPTRPETGYGYLELATPSPDGTPVGLKRFVEKPDARRATDMLAANNFLWNAGIFLFRADAMLAAFETHQPDMVPPVRLALEQGQKDLDFFRLAPEPWATLPDISIDFAVMEKSDTLSVVPYEGGWSDLGDWDAIWRETQRDGNGVGTHGASTAIDCCDSLLRSEDPGQELVGIGLNNILAVVTRDAVLVADMSRAQDVNQAVAVLKAKEAPQAVEFPFDFRPWGWYESLVVGGRFQVKRIHVHPGASLSLQSHHHRAEHWIVVEGTAKVTIDDTVQLVSENQSVYVPLGGVHRMENPGKVPMVLIEVQTGSYLGEDDIVRYEDVYARGQGAKG